MKYTSILFALLFTANLYATKSCAGKSVDCFNAEAQRWQTYNNADSCEDYYDGGWKTRSYCSENADPKSCDGKSVDCFDAETQRWTTFQGANTCNDYYDGGWKTEALCK